MEIFYIHIYLYSFYIFYYGICYTSIKYLGPWKTKYCVRDCFIQVWIVSPNASTLVDPVGFLILDWNWQPLIDLMDDVPMLVVPKFTYYSILTFTVFRQYNG